MSYILGLDFGGTKLAAGLVEPSIGAVVASARCPTPGDARGQPGRDDPASLTSCSGVMANPHPFTRSPLHPLPERRRRKPRPTGPGCHSLTGVGVSFGGPVEADGRTVRRSMHVPGWEAFGLADRLEGEFGAPALVANDADAAALAEQSFGAGRGVRHLLYLTVSTGIGGGVIINGRLHRGEHAWAGEIGHMPLVQDGPPCPCGRHGCLESLASGLSIARAARERLGREPRTENQEPRTNKEQRTKNKRAKNKGAGAEPRTENQEQAPARSTKNRRTSRS